MPQNCKTTLNHESIIISRKSFSFMQQNQPHNTLEVYYQYIQERNNIKLGSPSIKLSHIKQFSDLLCCSWAHRKMHQINNLKKI